MQETNSPPRMIGESASFLEMQEHISQVAPLNKPVLIVGERGTGKELVAARLHFLSTRWEQNFLKVNCAAMSETLLEAQLFGHEVGAYTGATKQRKGYFERAHGGTLFLDELANTAMPVQEKILRVIEYGEFERVGGSRPVKTDVRLICATNEDLPSLVERGKFRADLLDRLAFDVITLPPLRERQEDIMLLAETFAINMARQLELEYFGGFGAKAKQLMLDYEWPGNVRELKNVIERSLYRHNNAALPLQKIVLDPFSSPFRPLAKTTMAPAMSGSPVSDDTTVAESSSRIKFDFPLNFKDVTTDYEVKLIKQSLVEGQYSQKKAADLLGVTYHQLRGLLKKYQLLDDTST